MPARPSHHVDPRSPFVLDTRELGRRAGSMIELHREAPAPAGWGLELVSVPLGAPVELDVRLESVVDGVLATVELSAPLDAECGRCLEPVTDTLEVSLAELFVYEPDPDDDEVPVLDGDFLDLEAVAHDAVVLALPLNPVCDEDCRGLCVGCGVKLDDLEPGHSHDEIDPRWAALTALGEPDAGAEPAGRADAKHTAATKSATMDSAAAARRPASRASSSAPSGTSSSREK
jgi:uncharacterized protein